MKIFPIVFVVAAVFFFVPVANPQEGDSFQEAKNLLKEAIEKKSAGEAEPAVLLFEKALRKNRSILGEDDKGLISQLHDFYLKKLETSPNDIQVLEPLGFISAVCYSDFEKAIFYYEQVASQTTDESTKKKSELLVNRLRSQWNLVQTIGQEMDTRERDEKVKEWKELEKQEALAAVSEKTQKREERLRELNSKKEEIGARIPQAEDEVKEIEAEIDKADLYWRKTDNRRYRRKRENLKKDLENKKAALEKTKEDLDNTERELEQLQKESDSEQALLSGGRNPNDGIPEKNNSEDVSGNNDRGSEVKKPENGTEGDPVLPPPENQDFPAANASSTQWP